VTSSGALAEPPIALVEVQAYAYLAKLAVARLFEHNGEHARAKALRREAQALHERFNRDFWLADEGFLALGLHGKPRTAIDVISSNPGHALFCGIVPEDRARLIAERLMADDMYSGWGIRTLSTRERAYNPVGYHLGTVWPHDVALALAGFRRYGFDKMACRVFSDLLHAATFFAHDRLPEAFAGFERAGYGVPVRYPVACHPQAWAAGSVPFMLTALLGLAPDALERRLVISRPCLPAFIQHLELHALRVGDAEVDLSFDRSGESVAVHVTRKRGELEVVTDRDAPSDQSASHPPA
jgi:glycogen debranching enzyme